MPIPVVQLQKECIVSSFKGLPGSIMEFLKHHTDLGFNVEELARELSVDSTSDLVEALALLSDLGVVEERVVGGIDYYAVLNPIP